MSAALPSPADGRDHVAETIFLAGSESSVVPSELDYRPWLNPVRDQGGTSTCAAQTAACMKEWQEPVDGGVLADLSEQFIYNFRTNAPQEGMFGRDVMRILLKYGVSTEKDFPKSRSEPCENVEVLASARENRISEYARVHSARGLKLALNNSGPCYIAFPMYNTGSHFWRQNRETEKPSGHACAVVGYNSEGFIIRNSWGRTWADEGYTVYPYDDFGAHFEIWSCVDRKGTRTLPPAPPPRPRGVLARVADALTMCFRRLLNN